MTEQEFKQTVAHKILEFAALPEGWHFGEGVGATSDAVDSALSISALLADHQARNVEAFPCVDGGVLVHGYQGDDVLEIQCDPDRSIHFVHERSGGLVKDRESVSIDDIESYLGELAWVPISSLESSIHGITATSWVDTPAPPFNSLLPVSVSLCSIHDVELIAAGQNVPTFKISTKETTSTRWFFGDSAQTGYRQNAA